jgi:hypothetical protein
MTIESVELKWEEIFSGAFTGLLRQSESMRNNIKWGHGAKFSIYEEWGRSISGTICEMALSKKMQSYFSHSVNNYFGKDLIINNKPVQVRSQLHSKQNKSLIIRKPFNHEDYYFLVGDDTPNYYFYGYILARDVSSVGNWTNFNNDNRPYVWSVPFDKLKPIDQFKYEK